MESEEDKAEHSDPEKDEDVGITFVARQVDRPTSGETSHMTGHLPVTCSSSWFITCSSTWFSIKFNVLT